MTAEICADAIPGYDQVAVIVDWVRQNITYDYEGGYLLVSATEDQSPENSARRNITATRGLNTEMIAEAQTLSEQLSSAKNLLVPLDQYLKESENSSEKK